jgi:hypothetical protein
MGLFLKILYELGIYVVPVAFHPRLEACFCPKEFELRKFSDLRGSGATCHDNERSSSLNAGETLESKAVGA